MGTYDALGPEIRAAVQKMKGAKMGERTNVRFGPCQVCLRPLCQCPKPAPSALSREDLAYRVNSIANRNYENVEELLRLVKEVYAHDAAQRATIARQAQEIEWLKGHPMGHPIMGRNILQEDVAKLRMQLATAQARVTLLEEYQKACTGIEDNLAKCIEENEHLQATLAAKEAKIAELADLCRQAGLRLTELTSPVHEP